MRIAVIGSGFGGLAAAIRLRAQGHDVTIFEQRDQPGGRAGVIRQDGFTFDAGPTILTAPHLIDELFTICGADRRDYVELRRLDPAYSIRFPDGSVFEYHTEPTRLRAEVARFNADDARGYDAFARATSDIFAAAMSLIDKPFLSLTSMLAVAPQLARLRADRTVAALANAHFRDPRLRQVFSFHPLLVGGNPFATTSIYALIHKLEMEWGVWYAMGGTTALVHALVQVFERSGGRIEYGARVDEIVSDGSRATAVRLAGGRSFACDAVVSNADVASTYQRLVAPRARGRWSASRLGRQRYSMSLFVLYFGTRRRYDAMRHHEILMGPRYKELLTDIFDDKVLADDFSLYLHRPTATDPSLAPPEHDAFYVLSPVPHLGGQVDWTVMAQRYRDAIVQSLEQRYLPGLSSAIVTEQAIDPRHFRDALGSYLGSAFALQPVFGQSAWFRPHNRSESIENLYLAGAGTHPGAGIPGVISSGKIVADLIGTST